MINENKFIFSPCFQFINHNFLIKNKIKFLKKIKYNNILFFYNLILKINRSFETNEIFYLKIINEKFNKKTDKLIKKLHDYIFSIKELFNKSIAIYNKNNKILLLLILFNKKINKNIIKKIVKKNVNYFNYYIFRFEKNYCFKLKYKINKIKKILFI